MPIETTYKNYKAIIERDGPANCYRGRVDLPGHTLIFEAETLVDVAAEFQRAVDAFLTYVWIA